MSENVKNYRLIKVTPNTVLFDLHPVSNYALTRRIVLNNKQKQVALPQDWALGIFQDDALYNMYRQGYFTFDDNESIVRAAFEAGVYFGEELDFTPAKVTKVNDILEILKLGNRSKIQAAINDFGAEEVRDVAAANINQLSTGVVNMLEGLLHVQLRIDEDNVTQE